MYFCVLSQQAAARKITRVNIPNPHLTGPFKRFLDSLLL
jgi:hypothetical protein